MFVSLHLVSSVQMCQQASCLCRNPHSDLWLEFFHLLLNQPERGALHSLRCKLASVLQQNYSSKLPSLKNRLVVLLLENRKAARR